MHLQLQFVIGFFEITCRVVILGIQRLTGERAGVPAHYIGREPGVLDIFSEYSLKIPRIYLISPCRASVEVLWVRRAGRRTDNPDHMQDSDIFCKSYDIFFFSFQIRACCRSLP
jgi:hypothetical protein